MAVGLSLIYGVVRILILSDVTAQLAGTRPTNSTRRRRVLRDRVWIAVLGIDRRPEWVKLL